MLIRLTCASFAALGITAMFQDPAAPAPRSYSDYWDRGQAEIARYELSQSRYGQPRDGHALLVFVAEDFRRDTQVKDERYADPRQSVRVLKLNRIQRFTTGIYDYSLMQSVFTPVDGERDPHTLKTTTSVQDWCGHVWSQRNRTADGYRITGHSYFESEGEESREILSATLEDELFSLVRIDPTRLPTGQVRMIPGSFDSRLRHRPDRVEKATASLTNVDDGTRRYTVEYASGRTFSITFEAALPRGILAFREAVGRQVTEARRTHVEQSAYWNKSGNSHAASRASIGLEPGDIGRR